MKIRASIIVVLVVGAVTATPPASAKGAIPITTCGFVAWQPGQTYRLAADLTCNASVGIVVDGRGVTIDLGRHVLSGDGSPSHSGVVFEASGALRNGTIRGFGGHGVRALDEASVSVTKASIVDNGVGLGDGSGVAVTRGSLRAKDVVTSGNAGDGILVADEAPPPTLTSVIASHNRDAGVRTLSPGMRLSDSIIAANGDEGVSLVGPASVSSTHVLNNGNGGTDNGIDAVGEDIRITSSVVSGNYFGGIVVNGAAILDRNRAEANGWGAPDGFGTGMLVTGAFKASKNISRGNDDNGINCNPTAMCSSGFKTITGVDPRFLAVPGCNSSLDQPGRTYVLENDLTCANNGISIDAADVTLDLNGRTLTGSGASQAVYVGPLGRRARIRNGAITRFNVGIVSTDAGPAPTVRIDDVLTYRNTSLGLETFGEATLNRVSAIRNSGTAWAAGGPGLHRIADSLVTANGIGGFAMTTGEFIGAIEVDRVVVAGNRAPANEYAIELEGDEFTIKKSRIVGNDFGGILVKPPMDGKLSGNVVSSNGWGVGDGAGPGIDAGFADVRGRNRARGNDHEAFQCDPGNLCS